MNVGKFIFCMVPPLVMYSFIVDITFLSYKRTFNLINYSAPLAPKIILSDAGLLVLLPGE
jgi:hypothetical protein